MKKRGFLLLLCVFIVTTCAVVPPLEYPVVKVGYCDTDRLLGTKASAGFDCFAKTYFEEIAKYTGSRYEYVKCEADEVEAMLASGAIDIFGLSSEPMNGMRGKLYSSRPFGYEEVLLVAPKEANVKLTGKLLFDQCVIISSNQNIYLDKLNTYLKMNAYTAEILVSPTEDELATIDPEKPILYLVGSLHVDEHYDVVEELGQVPFYCISTWRNYGILQSIDLAIHQIFNKDFLFFEKLVLKHLDNVDLHAPYLMKEEFATLLSQKVYYVGYAKEQAPVCYMDGAGQPAGIAVDVLNRIADAVGFKVFYVPLDENSVFLQEQLDMSLSMKEDEFTEEEGIETYYVKGGFSHPIRMTAAHLW